MKDEPFIALWESVARLLDPVPDGVRGDVVLLCQIGGADVVLEHLSHDPRALVGRERRRRDTVVKHEDAAKHSIGQLESSSPSSSKS